MQKELNVIKLVLVVFIFTASCSPKTKTDYSMEFLEYYFSENYKEHSIVNLIKNNSNEKIYEALYRYSENPLKQNDLIKEILSDNELFRIKEQVVRNSEWSSEIENRVKSINLSEDNNETFFVAKPIFCQNNKFCLIYSYEKKDDIYFIPSIEVYRKIKNKNWSKIGKISHF